MYRIIDFKRKKDNVWASVVSIEYDPNRSSRIALLQYEDGEKAYILAPEGLKAGDRIMSGEEAEPRVGKHRRFRFKVGRLSNWKKAIITLKPDSPTIEFF